MDVETLCATIAVAKGLPDTAVGRAETAAREAEAAAEIAAQHSMGVSISGTKLIFTPIEEGD